MVACVEEIAYTLGYISEAEVLRQAKSMKGNAYGQYLFRLIQNESE